MQKAFIYGLFLLVLPIYCQENVQQLIDDIISKESFGEEVIGDIQKVDPDFHRATQYLAQLIPQQNVAKKAISLLKMLDPYWNYSDAVKKIVPQLVANFKNSRDYEPKVLFCECLGEIGRGAFAALPELIVVYAHLRGVWDPPAGATLKKIYPKWNTLPIAKRLIPRILTKVGFFSRSEHIIATLDSIDPQWPKDPRVRETIPHIVNYFTAAQPRTVTTAITILKKIEPQWVKLPQVQKIMPHLATRLQENPTIYLDSVSEVIQQMGKSADQRFAPILIELHNKQGFHSDILSALSYMTSHPEDVVPILAEAFAQSNTDLQSATLRGLLSLPGVPQQTFSEVMNKLKTVHWFSYRVLYALQETKNPKALPFLVEALQSTNNQFRYNVLATIGKYGPLAISTVPQLQKLFAESQDSLLHQYIVSALISIAEGNEELLQQAKNLQILHTLQKLLSEAYYDHLRKAHHKSLKEIDANWRNSSAAKQFIDKLLPQLTQTKVLQILSEIGPPPTSFPEYVKLLDHKNNKIAQFAVKSIPFFEKGASLVPKLLTMLTHNNVEVAQSAWEALNKIDRNWPQSAQAQQHLPQIAKALHRYRDWYFRQYVANLLAFMGNNAQGAIPEIFNVLSGNFANHQLVETLEKIDPQWKDLPITRDKVAELKQRQNKQNSVAQQLGIFAKKEDLDTVIPFVEQQTFATLKVLAQVDVATAFPFCKTHFSHLETHQQHEIIKLVAQGHSALHSTLLLDLLVISPRDTRQQFRSHINVHEKTMFDTLVKLNHHNLHEEMAVVLQKLENAPHSPQVQQAAILFALQQMKKPLSECYTMCKWLESQKIKSQISAKPVLKEVRELLDHHSWFIRSIAAKTLWQIHSSQHLEIELLFTALKDPDPEVQAYALKILADFKSDPDLKKHINTLVSLILPMAIHEHWFLRHAGNEALTIVDCSEAIVSAEIVKSLLNATNNHHQEIASSALSILSKINITHHKEDISLYLVEQLQKTYPQLDMQKLRILIQALDPNLDKLISTLAQKLEDQQAPSEHLSAARANLILILVQMGDIATKPLIDMATEAKSRSFVLYEMNIRQITNEKALAFYRQALNDEDYNNRCNAIKAIANTKSPKVVPEILQFLEEENYHVRTSVLESLAKIGKKAASQSTTPLILFLTQRDSGLVRLAEKALQQVCPEWNHPQITTPLLAKIIQRFDTEDIFVRRNTLKLLERIDKNWVKSSHAKDALPTLIDRFVSISSYDQEGFPELLTQIDPQWASSWQMQDIYLNTIDDINIIKDIDKCEANAEILKNLMPHFEQYLQVVQQNLHKEEQIKQQTLQQLQALQNSVNQAQKSTMAKYETSSRYNQTRWRAIFRQLSQVKILLDAIKKP